MPRILAQLEGEIENVPQLRAADGNVVFTVLGVTVVVTPTAEANGRISTPTKQKNLKLADLVKTDPIPGVGSSVNQGFKGCTAIVVGNMDPTKTPLELVVDYLIPQSGDPPLDPLSELHPSLEIGPPESVLLGPLTRALGADGRIQVNGVPVQILDPNAPDKRLIASEATNEFGIPVDLRLVQPSTPVSVDGYPSDDGPDKRFIGFTISVDSPSATILADRTAPQLGITRAQARVGGGQVEYEIRGGVYAGAASTSPPAQQQIEVIGHIDSNTTFSIGLDAPRAAPGDFDTWRVRTTHPLPLPSAITAKYKNAPGGEVVTDAEPLDVRDDPDVPPLP